MKKIGKSKIYIEITDTKKINARMGDLHIIKDIAIGLLLIPFLKNLLAAAVIAYLLVLIDCEIYAKSK